MRLEETAVTRQQHSMHLSTVKNLLETIDELLEVFSLRSVQRIWKRQLDNRVKHFGVILEESIILRLHTDITEAGAFRIFIKVYSLFKSKRLSDNIKLIFHKALIKSIMAYTCPVWRFSAETPTFWNSSAWITSFSTPLVNFQGQHWSVNYTWLSNYRLFLII